MPYRIFQDIGSIDRHYVHSLGDFDYGMEISGRGYPIYASREYIGICDNNPLDGTWRDRSLSVMKRIREKEGVKGVPTRQWFYFLKKNFGVLTALKGVCTPFIRIILGI